MKDDFRRAFETYWRTVKGPELLTEFKFHPKRRFRFDFADPASRVAIELEGGTWAGGRHTRGAGYAKDCEKYNLATLLGWRVFRFTVDMLRDNPHGHLKPVRDLIYASAPVPTDIKKCGP